MKRRWFQIHLIFVCHFAMVGCSQQNTVPLRQTKSPPLPQPRPQPRAETSHGLCIVSGTVSVSSENFSRNKALKVSTNGKLIEAVIYVKEPPLHDEAKIDSTLTIKHINSEYVPRVSAARVGQLIQVVNEDKELHTNHVLSLLNKQKGAEYFDPKLSRFTFEEAEIYVTLQCDLHKEEKGLIAVFDHPFFGVSSADGEYKLGAPLSSGKYVLEAKHETLGTLQKQISISDEANITVNFEFNTSN